jgi:cold shock CspA family protein
MEQQRILGRVKWFNNKLGYGFITYRGFASPLYSNTTLTNSDLNFLNSNDKREKDIFVHWSHLVIPGKEFHTLYQGEYVEFSIIPCDIGDQHKKHTIQAHDVTGPNRGPLMATSNKTLLSFVQGTLSSNIFKVQQVPPVTHQNSIYI